MHIGNAGKTGTIIVNFQEQPAIRSIRRTKIEKRRLMTYSVFLFVCWFWMYKGKPNIRPRSSQNLECQRAGPNPGHRAGTHSFNQLPKKILVFSYKIPPTHTCLENKSEWICRVVLVPCTPSTCTMHIMTKSPFFEQLF